MLASPPGERANGGERLIQDGDMVIVYERHDRMKAVTVKKGQQLQNRYGLFNHNDWIGKPFGCKVVGNNGQSFVHLLAPTPELWTLSLPHRTQILYVADISFIILYLEIRPGCVVLESGTGSGSLTTSLARAVAPTGHVHTFDFHEQRAKAAREDFEKNKLSQLVTAYKRDIQGEGFPDEFQNKCDAAFLDLPQPWLAVPSVSTSLRWGGSVCSFSPCIEQVQRTASALLDNKFTDIRTFEVLLRTYEVQQVALGTLLKTSERNSEQALSASPPHKRICVADDSHVEKRSVEIMSGSAPNGVSDKDPIRSGSVLARPYSEAKGHTGYLTFARIFT